MTVLIVPALDEEPWPTLGRQVCEFLEERAVFGPGSLKGEPARLDPEKRAALYRAYEVYPAGHEFAGRRRFKRAGLSWRKGTAKTEWAAWVAYVELHPEGPVRCDGFDAAGEPVGRPVRDPYIPLLAYTEEQTEDLAYAALLTVVTEGPDADLFDAGLDRILRLDHRGRADGKATALAGSPNARDGARTTFQHFDEPHRMSLPKLLEAHETMTANLPKRPLEDPWSLYTSTAGDLGDGSVAEFLLGEAQAIARGEVVDPELFYFHREAGPEHDLSTLEGRLRAVEDATGMAGEYGPGQFRDIAKQWDRVGADLHYLCRVWLNRWQPKRLSVVLSAVDPETWAKLADPDAPRGKPVAWGLDLAEDRSVSLAVAWRRPDGRPQVMIAGSWSTSLGAAAEIAMKARRWRGWVFLGGPAEALAPELVKANVAVEALTGTEFTAACGSLRDLARNDGVRHGNQPELNEAVAASRWRPVGTAGAGQWQLRDAPGVGPLVAATRAVHGLLTRTAPPAPVLVDGSALTSDVDRMNF